MRASPDFANRLLAWFDQHGRHDLPWQHPRSVYRVWVAEIMLQQTQVVTVIDYYQRFMQHFPDVGSLATAPLDDVLSLWAGLGYYSRARNLHKAARIIQADYRGVFPGDIDAVTALPGIGPSTAGAILAQAFGQRHAIVDGNVRRVLCRYHGIGGWPGRADVSRKLWRLAQMHLPQRRLADYSQAIMDLGATLCARSRPVCGTCPLSEDCVALRTHRVAELPAPRPRRVRPTRAIQLLLISRSEGEVLLERRPPSGIWGGLWSLPELPAATEPVRYCQTRYGLDTSLQQELPSFKHQLTHFEMQLRPLKMRVNGGTNSIQESAELLWHHPRHKPPGLPRPIQKLIHSLDS